MKGPIIIGKKAIVFVIFQSLS